MWNWPINLKKNETELSNTLIYYNLDLKINSKSSHLTCVLYFSSPYRGNNDFWIKLWKLNKIGTYQHSTILSPYLNFTFYTFSFLVMPEGWVFSFWLCFSLVLYFIFSLSLLNSLTYFIFNYLWLQAPRFHVARMNR